MGKLFDEIVTDLKTIEADFRINDLNEAIEIKFKSDQWNLLDDTIEAVIRTELREMGYGIKGAGKANRTAVNEAWTTLAHRQRYNPIKDYLEKQATKYRPVTPDGAVTPQPYLINKFAEHIDNPDGMFAQWLFRWTCGAIAKVYYQERNPMLVLSGAQEKGKSTLVRWYCPFDLLDYFREGAIKPDVKDEKIRLVDTFLQEVGELGSTTRKADVEGLKEFLTLKHVVERPPYGSRPMKKPAICSFIGTVNHDGAGFLADTTGNSRFLVCEVNDIDFAYSQSNSDVLWAEAMWFFRNSHNPWQLSAQERQVRDIINKQYQMVNALEDVVLHQLDVTSDDSHFLTTMQIRQIISVHYRYTSEQAFNRELSKTLKALGCTPARQAYNDTGPHYRGWRGIREKESHDAPQ